MPCIDNKLLSNSDVVNIFLLDSDIKCFYARENIMIVIPKIREFVHELMAENFENFENFQELLNVFENTSENMIDITQDKRLISVHKSMINVIRTIQSMQSDIFDMKSEYQYKLGAKFFSGKEADTFLLDHYIDNKLYLRIDNDEDLKNLNKYISLKQIAEKTLQFNKENFYSLFNEDINLSELSFLEDDINQFLLDLNNKNKKEEIDDFGLNSQHMINVKESFDAFMPLMKDLIEHKDSKNIKNFLEIVEFFNKNYSNQIFKDIFSSIIAERYLIHEKLLDMPNYLLDLQYINFDFYVDFANLISKLTNKTNKFRKFMEEIVASFQEVEVMES